MKLGADMKVNSFNFSGAAWNAGLAYTSPMGLTAVAYHHKGQVTALHCADISFGNGKDVSCALEVVQSVGNSAPPAVPLTAAVGFKVDKTTQLRARANNKGEVNVALRKDVTPNVTVNASTVFDVMNVKGLTAGGLPSLGFKIAVKA